MEGGKKQTRLPELISGSQFKKNNNEKNFRVLFLISITICSFKALEENLHSLLPPPFSPSNTATHVMQVQKSGGRPGGRLRRFYPLAECQSLAGDGSSSKRSLTPFDFVLTHIIFVCRLFVSFCCRPTSKLQRSGST